MDKFSAALHLDKFRILLTGDKNTGKTSLAFKLAYDCAAKGESPLFICNKNKIESQMPLIVKSALSPHANWSPELLSRICMKYITSVTELKALFAGFHCFEPRPSMIIIDDFTLFIDPLMSVSRNDVKFIDSCIMLSSFITDVVDYFDSTAVPRSITINLETSHPTTTKLVIVDECNDANFLHIMQRYVSGVFRIKSPSSGASLVSSFNPYPGRSTERGPLQLVFRSWPKKKSHVSAGEVVVFQSIQCTNNALLLIE